MSLTLSTHILFTWLLGLPHNTVARSSRPAMAADFSCSACSQRLRHTCKVLSLYLFLKSHQPTQIPGHRGIDSVPQWEDGMSIQERKELVGGGHLESNHHKATGSLLQGLTAPPEDILQLDVCSASLWQAESRQSVLPGALLNDTSMGV